MPQFPANIDLSSLNGSTGFKLSGGAAYDYSGISVASAGDVNGDGFADVIIGAHEADPHGSMSGASYVVFGKASGFAANIDLSSLDGSNGFKLSGHDSPGWTGYSVASVGDINGDGFADLIVGAPRAGPDEGVSYVVFGHASGFDPDIDLWFLGSGGLMIRFLEDSASFGRSVAAAGDVNGDGFADMIIGAPRAGYTDSGTTYVILGDPWGSDSYFELTGEAAYDYSGWSVASAGDVNGDGFADLIVGAPAADPHGTESGKSYVVFGKASVSANIDLSSLDGSGGFKLSGVAASDYSGWSVASAGDVNGDGFADVIVGAPGANPHGYNSGASYVVFGKASGFAANVDLSDLTGSNGFKLSGEAAYDNSGHSVASAGDVNGDGFADVIVGARYADPHGALSGTSYVVFGKASGFAANVDLSGLDGSNGFKLSGVAAYDVSGTSVASAGDVNGDGFADLIVGAHGADPNGGGSGASYVIFGIAPDTAVNRTGTAASQTLAGGAFADTLSGLGGEDHLFGNGGGDTLKGGGGRDIVNGGGGADRLFGNDGGDTLNGGTGNDLLIGGRAGDLLVGGSGLDTVVCTNVLDSTGRSYDTITGFNANAEFFDLPVAVAGIDPAIVSGKLSVSNFNGDLAAAANAARLLAHHAVLFLPDDGAHTGERFLIVDANGAAGYQTSEDFVFLLDAPSNLASLSTDRFV